MIKKLILLQIIFLSINIYSIEKDSSGFSFNSLEVYQESDEDSKIIGKIEAYSVFTIKEMKQLKSSNDEVILWYKVSIGKIDGWITDYNMYLIPAKGLTKVSDNAGQWVIFKDRLQNTVSHNYYPEEVVEVVDVSASNDKVMYNVRHNNKLGWIENKYIKLSTSYENRLVLIMESYDLNRKFLTVEEIAKTFDSVKNYRVSEINEYGMFKVIYDSAILSCYKSNSYYRVANIEISNEYDLLYGVKIDSNLNYIKKILGNDYILQNGELKYEFSKSIFSEPIYTIMFKEYKNKVSKIRLFFPIIY